MDDELLMRLAEMIELYFLFGERSNSRSLIRLSDGTAFNDEDDDILVRLQLLDFIESALNDAGYEKRGCKDETQ